LESAHRLDPMLADRPAAIGRFIARACEGQPSGSPLRRHRRRLARIVRESVMG
jgi:hypothetical protein